MSRLRSFLLGHRIANSPPPRYLSIRSSKTFILVVICIAVFTDIFLYGIVVPVIPFAISQRAHVANDNVQSWVSVLLAVYGAALLVVSPVAGWYADHSSSRREPLLFGLLALLGATLMLCLARSVAVLVLGRVLQGLSAGVVWTVGTALLVDTVGQKNVGQMMGYVSVSMSVGILIAPLIGGVVYERCGYYAVYYVCFALIGCDVVLRLLLVEKKVAAQWDDEDVGDTAGEEAAVEEAEKKDETTIGESHNLVHEGEAGLTPEKTATELPESSTSSSPSAPPSTSDLQPQRTKLPPILTLLTSKRLLAALWGCFVQASLMTAFDSVLPLFVARTFNWTSLGAGLIFLASFIPSFSAPLVGWASDKYGPRWLCVAGFLLAVPFWILLRFVTHDSLSQKVLLCALLALLGVALTVAMTPLMAEITYVVEAKEKRKPGSFGKTGAYAQAYGLFVCAFAAGTLVGPLWSGLVVDRSGWGTMTWSLSLLSASGSVPALIWTGGLITEDNAKSGEERAVGRAKVKGQGAREGADANV